MARNLIIVGACSFARDILEWVPEYARDRDWVIKGVLDEKPEGLEKFVNKIPYLGSPSSYVPTAEDVFVCAFGDPKLKIDTSMQLLQRGAKFETLIHPNVIVGGSCKIGVGCVICPGSIVTSSAVIGDHVAINVLSSIGHDVVIGEGSTISGHCDLTGGCTLGKGVFMGTHGSLIPGICVGDFATIGAGAVVLKDVPSGVTVFGVPARQVKGG